MYYLYAFYSVGIKRRKRNILLACSTAAIVLLLVCQFGTSVEPLKLEILNGSALSLPENQSSEILDIQSLDQKDKRLWDYVRNHFIIIPSKLEYSFGIKDKVLPQIETATDNVIRELFKYKVKFINICMLNAVELAQPFKIVELQIKETKYHTYFYFAF